MSDNIKEPEIIVEENGDNLLENFENQPQKKPTKTKKNSHIKALIAAIAGAVVLVGVICLIIFAPNGDSPTEKTYEEAAAPVVDENKMWQVTPKDNSAKDEDSYDGGNLLDLVPADISKINVENEGGTFEITSYTPTEKSDETDPETGESVETTLTTVYTLVGYEDFEMQAGVPDEIASACSTLSYSAVATTDGSKSLKDWGMDEPRSTVTVTFVDGTKAVIKVGADAPQGLGTYVMFGTGNAVYLCDTDTVSPLLFKVSDLMNLSITDSVSETGDTDASQITLKGTAYESEIVLKPNTDTDHIQNSFIITSPETNYADDNAASLITGAIKGLYADSVEMVNPSGAQLKKLGLSTPYAQVIAKYSGATENLIASSPDDEGNVYLMKNGGKVVYKMAAANVGWVTAKYESLISPYVLYNRYDSLSGITVTAGDKTYDFKVTTTVTKADDDETESTNTVATYMGNELNQGNFETFYRNMSMLTKLDSTAKSPSGSPALTVKYSYEEGRKADTIAFYKDSTSKYVVTVNGAAKGTVNASYVEKLIIQAPDAAVDKEVKSFW
ncbi:MAG: DUF4340 domain-containing protein [Ruminococcus sp.]|nr:DUF4340 domain-containing protein [Ruminococcus sp.]